MNKCRICGENLYKIITFNNIFITNYEFHTNCIDKLDINLEEEVIPIESNIIIYDYVFNNVNANINEEYLWLRYIGNLIEKHTHIEKWSMIIIYDDFIEIFLKKMNPYLLINLTNNPIILLSLKRENTVNLEGL